MQASAAAPARVRALLPGSRSSGCWPSAPWSSCSSSSRSSFRHFASTNNYIGILQATAVNGVLAIGVTFVIITGGIDLSVGTLMTFCAVVAGVFLTYWALPLSLGVARRDRRPARSCGIVIGHAHREGEDAAVHRHAGHDAACSRGCRWSSRATSRSISTTRRDFSQISQDSLIGYVVPGVPIPNAVLILFVLAVVALDPAQPHDARPLHVRARQQRGGGAAVRRQRRPLEDRDLRARRRYLRHRRHAHRLAPEFGAAGARPGLRARSDRGGRHRRHVAQRRHGHDPRHDHRRVHHERADQRPAHHVASRRNGRSWSPASSSSSPSTPTSCGAGEMSGRRTSERATLQRGGAANG